MKKSDFFNRLQEEGKFQLVQPSEEIMFSYLKKSFLNIMPCRIQHPKALERAPQGTLAFRSYLLRSYYTILYNKGLGGLELKIPLPSLPEQRRIVEMPSAGDRKLELGRSRKEKMENVKKGADG